MCFLGFLRSGEVVVPSDSAFDPSMHLAYGDVRADNTSSSQFLEVRIKASKTDPFRVGVAVYLGRTNCALCLVAAVLGYTVGANKKLTHRTAAVPHRNRTCTVPLQY